jgi:hypothetical protein
LQQPCGHDVASHTHWPVDLLHSLPLAHPAHVAPPLPHDVFDSLAYASHVPVAPPLQQPLGHVFASHLQAPTVVSQSPFAHDVHDAPPAPHCEDDCDA